MIYYVMRPKIIVLLAHIIVHNYFIPNNYANILPMHYKYRS